MKKSKIQKKTIVIGDKWVAGEETQTEIRPEKGIMHRRCVTENVDVLDPKTKKIIKQIRKILEQKVVWSDGQEHVLARILMD
jgi:hypothetical protein